MRIGIQLETYLMVILFPEINVAKHENKVKKDDLKLCVKYFLCADDASLQFPRFKLYCLQGIQRTLGA